MKKQNIYSAVKERCLASDGGWGTFLQEQGLQPGECPELWCLEQPEKVAEAAEAYIKAGADMIQSNSFGGSRYKLDMFGLGDKTYEINRSAAAISRQAAGDEHWVISSLGPSGKMLTLGEVSEDDLYQVFREQCKALAEGGADAICVETMSAVDEASIAVRAARENTDLEVICTFVFSSTPRENEYRTMMGVSPSEAARAAVEAGAHIIGSNCGNGLAGMVEVVRQMKEVVDANVPILIHGNAGMPELVDGREVFPETPEMMAGHVPGLIRAGANIIGGCCGTTPEHVAAVKQAVEKINSGS